MSNCCGDKIDNSSAETHNPKHDDESETLLSIARINLTEHSVCDRKNHCDQCHANSPRYEEIQKAKVSLGRGWY